MLTALLLLLVGHRYWALNLPVVKILDDMEIINLC